VDRGYFFPSLSKAKVAAHDQPWLAHVCVAAWSFVLQKVNFDPCAWPGLNRSARDVRFYISIGGLFFLGALFSLSARSADMAIPAPQGLSACTPDSQLLVTMKRAASAFGTLAGCFASVEKVSVHGMEKPMESAFAITLSQGASGPFTVAGVDQLYAATERQWKNVASLWNKDKTAYEQRVRKLIQEASSSASGRASMSIEQPVLVSMQRISPGSYMVVSIRHRKISKDGAVFSFDTVDGDAIILSDGKLTRLTIQRQLRGQGDVDAVKSGISDWLQKTSKALLAN
jgi:hypothetical protein